MPKQMILRVLNRILVSRRMRAQLAVCVIFTMLGFIGCNQNQGGQTPATPYSGVNTFGTAAPSSSYAADMQAKANEQVRLANEQQRQLETMRQQQARTESQLAALQKQQQQAKTDISNDQKAQEVMLADQAREALGRYDELGRRAKSLDQRNQDLYADFSQVQQRVQLLEDQNNLLQQRLKETSNQLANALKTSEEASDKYDSLLTSSQRRSGAAITANNSYRKSLTAVTVEGLNVRQDGDLVRIEIPTDRLFASDGASLRPDANLVINQVSDAILRNYPRQVVGIEAHAESEPTSATGWRSAHQLTAAQAMVVFEAISAQHQSLKSQLFVLGHGTNYPLASNATVTGQSKNRRVEIVVYPQTAGNR
ncbi:MAG: OmpA family protein [Pirellulaceae bacterium]|nr:OmpA family protein [Pirellulaceae bacterium]